MVKESPKQFDLVNPFLLSLSFYLPQSSKRKKNVLHFKIN